MQKGRYIDSHIHKLNPVKETGSKKSYHSGYFLDRVTDRK